jgi:DNA-binding response OmpR family regulator
MSSPKGVRVADKILVIDDDPNVAELIKLILKPRGLSIFHAINGQEGLKQAYELQPDLIILDIMMPEQDGYEVCARLRELSDVPIVMLTAKSQSSDVTRGFAVGADDYVKKPFSNDELVSRIESLLRRKKSNDSSANITGYSDGLLEVEFSTQKVLLQGEEVALTPTEFKLLAFMIRHPQKTLSTRTLLAEVWGNAYSHDKALLSLYVHQVRQKLKEEETEHAYIKTHWGQGYWFNPLPQASKPVLEPVSSEPQAEEQEETKVLEEEKKKERDLTALFKKKWFWAAIGFLVGLLAFILYLQNITLRFTNDRDGNLTNIEAQVSAEGFRETATSGLRGEICLENTGAYPTENLSIVNAVQVYTGSSVRSFSRTVDVSEHSIIDPGGTNTYCYPYELTVESDAGQVVEFHMRTSITITNHVATQTGSVNCPMSGPCPYGPEIPTDLMLPVP